MTFVSRYIAKRIAKGIFTAFYIVTAIIILVDFVEATRSFGDNANTSLLTIAGLTLLKTPQLIEETIPFVVLFGVMGALHGLNKSSELIVMRASGLSIWQIIWPAICVTGCLGIIWATVFNPYAALSNTKYRSLLSDITIPQTQQSQIRTEDVWLREGIDTGQVVIHGTMTSDAPNKLEDVTFYYFEFPTKLPDALRTSPQGQREDSPTQFTRRIDASEAILETNGYWKIRGIIENLEGQNPKNEISASFPTAITQNDILDHAKRKNRPAFWQAQKEINDAERAGFSTVSLRLHFQKLLSLPLTLIAMTFIAAGVSMRLVRSGGTLRLMLMGSVIGFGFYFINSVMGAFGGAQSLPIILASWAVPVFVLLCSIAYLAKIEDG